ncbi:MAG: hypothetical protein SWH68_04285 [Thermodesulfobacteriota bacterium]|nr:hypothetical protein [Thermodesulfobacteriota bacterium]
MAADLLNASLGGSGDVKITGKYAVCDDITTWGGSGDITAEVELASQVTANMPTVNCYVPHYLAPKSHIIEVIPMLQNKANKSALFKLKSYD